MARIAKVRFEFLVDDDATQGQIDAVIADAVAQFNQAALPTGEVFVRSNVSSPGFPGRVG